MVGKEIILEVGVDGSVKLEAVGFKGGTCQAALEPLQEILGMTVDVRRKPEFYQHETERVRHGQK